MGDEIAFFFSRCCHDSYRDHNFDFSLAIQCCRAPKEGIALIRMPTRVPADALKFSDVSEGQLCSQYGPTEVSCGRSWKTTAFSELQSERQCALYHR